MTARPILARTCALGLALGLPLFGCNAVDSSADRTMAEQELARPAAIVVQEFAISPDAPEPTDGTGDHTSGDDAEQVARKFQASLASHLVAAIRAMGLPAVGADAPLPSSGTVVTVEGRFVSVPGGDSAEAPIVALANSWPEVVVDVEIYDTSATDDRLSEDMEFRISDTNPLIPPEAPAGEPTEPQGTGSAAQSTISPAIQAKLEAAARDGADVIAKQLAPFFADQGWIAAPHG